MSIILSVCFCSTLSSPCSRSAASTWRFDQAEERHHSAVADAPTWSASVDSAIGRPPADSARLAIEG